MTIPQAIPFFSAAANFAASSDTPREYLERCLARLEAFEPGVGAFVCHDIAAARAAADRSSARWRDGRPLSLIDGMPLGIKDIIETADMPTEQGSPLFVGWRTGRDAASVAALRITRGRRGDPRQGRDDGVRRDRAARHPQSVGPRAHPGRIEQRLRRRRGLRHGAGGPWHPGRRLDPTAGELLRLRRLQAERRRDQSRRQLRLLQPELHRCSCGLSRRCLARRGQYRGAGGRRPRLSGFTGTVRTAPPQRPRSLAVLQTSGWEDAAPTPAPPSSRQRRASPRPVSSSPTDMPIPLSMLSSGRLPMRLR